MKKYKAYKVLTHDYCSPIQGGKPIFDGKLPFTLPVVKVDSSEKECAAGWNACREIYTALQIGGLWPNGWPSKCYEVETEHPVVERGNKVRTVSWDLIRLVSESEIKVVVEELSEPFGKFQEEMVNEQMLWREALARSKKNEVKVERDLKEVLKVRRFSWKLKKHEDAQTVWDARTTWGARSVRGVWQDRDAQIARSAQNAWDAWNVWSSWYARSAWATWSFWNDWNAQGARNARNALMVYYVARGKWIKCDKNILTVDIRDAYKNGLAIAIPTEKNVLGWAMV